MDKAPVMGETFIQWVVEDNFKDNVRPALEEVGVELVDSVIPYEEAKIRVLNVPHAVIAWAGTLQGESSDPQQHAERARAPSGL